MERNFESYGDLTENGQHSEMTENQGVTLKPFVPLPQLSAFPKQPEVWKRTVEQNIVGLRRTLEGVAGNVGIIAENMVTKTDFAEFKQELKDMISLGQQQPAASTGAYQKPVPVKQTPVQGQAGQQGQANQGQ